MPKSLPASPSIVHLKDQAKELLKAHRNRDPAVCPVLRLMHRFGRVPDEEILRAEVSLQEAQFALAMDYGFAGWNELKAFVETKAGGTTMHAEKEDHGPKREEETNKALSGRPLSQRNAEELVPVLVALSGYARWFGLAALADKVEKSTDDEILRLATRMAAEGTDRELVLETMQIRKKSMLDDYERRLDMMVMGVNQILQGLNPGIMEKMGRASLPGGGK